MISNSLSNLPLTLDFTGPPISAHQARSCAIIVGDSANGPNGTITGPGAASFGTGRAEHPAGDHNTQLLASPQSFRSGHSPHVGNDTWGTTPRGHRSTSRSWLHRQTFFSACASSTNSAVGEASTSIIAGGILAAIVAIAGITFAILHFLVGSL